MPHDDRPSYSDTNPLQSVRLGRRPLLAGLGVAGIGAAAATARLLTGGDGGSDAPQTAPDANPTAATRANAPADPDPAAQAPQQAPVRITEVADRAAASAAQTAGDGFALVTSPRLPLFGIGSADRDGLLSGQITNWRDVGSGAAIPVELLALDGETPDGSNPVETVVDYDALAAALWERPGAFAVIPTDQVDFRANVLSIDNLDPVRDRDGDDGPLRIAVVGDIIGGRNVHLTQQEYGDFTHAFWKVADHLAAYDVAIANLECTLSDSLPQPENPRSYSFVTSPELADGIAMAGIDAVSLANNHSTWNDEGWGVQGLLDTIAVLNDREIPYFGAGNDLDEARRVFTIEAKGRRIAFLGVDGVTANQDYPEPNDAVRGVVWAESAATDGTPGTNPYAFDQVISDVEAAAADHDIVIPYLHMGAEYKWLVPEWVTDAAQGCIDAGASVVVTNHPHVIQGMAVYKNVPIVYSVGNFIFDQMFSVDTRQGLILELVFDGTKVVGLRTRGVEIEEFHQPRLMTGGEQAAIMDRFWRSTDWLAER